MTSGCRTRCTCTATTSATPGNVATTLETMKVLEGRRAHLAHLQYHAYGGDDWVTMRSEAAQIAEYFNAHPNLTTDAGAVLFGNTVTITADGPWQHLLYQLTGRKWGNLDVENETGCGIVPYVYKEKHLVNAVQWAVGLELLLLIDDPWRVFLTTDHPNGAAFWRYPEIIQLLMDRGLPQGAGQGAAGEGAEADRPARTWTASTRSPRSPSSRRPARRGRSGWRRRGTSASGRTPTWRSTTSGPTAWRMFAATRATSSRAARSWSRRARSGRSVEGREFVVRPAYDEKIEDYLRPLFQQYYTMSFDNYPVEAERVHGMQLAECRIPPDTDGACIR